MRIIKLTSGILAMFLIILSFSACSETPSDPDKSVCILYGNTRNVGLPRDDVLENEIEQMAEAVTNCSVIVIDGNSDTYSYSNTIKYPKAFFLTQESNNKKYVENIMQNIVKCTPDTEEIDIISALYSAEKELSKNNTENKKIVIFSSGISTTGELDFYNNPKLIEEEPEVIVNMLKKSNSLPDLDNAEVEWHGFGLVEEPQSRLTKTNEYRLKNIWEAILKACDAEIVGDSINAEIGSDINYDVEELKKDYRKVSVVDFPGIIEIDETRVEFQEGSDKFLDEEKVYKELEPYADLMLESGCKNFYLVGSTASDGDRSGCLSLSTERAEAVKDVLCSFGVPSSYLDVYGIGRENFGGNYGWRVNDLNSNGKLEGDLAQQNRKVMIIEKDSDKGNEFIKIWNDTMK